MNDNLTTTASNEAESPAFLQGAVISSLSELGLAGLTWDWSKMELGKQYFVSREDVLNMNMLWQLAQGGITAQAQNLSAEVLMWEDVIKNGWFIKLRQKGCL
jgi:hypothetical protein